MCSASNNLIFPLKEQTFSEIFSEHIEHTAKTKSFRLKIETKANIFRGTTQIAYKTPLRLITAADRSSLQHQTVLRKDCSEVSKNTAPNVSHRPTSLFAHAYILCPLQRI